MTTDEQLHIYTGHFICPFYPTHRLDHGLHCIDCDPHYRGCNCPACRSSRKVTK